MEGFAREDRRFSLCGLNCALCPMQLGNYCPGCGGGPGNQPCAMARCSLQKGKPEYCFQCGEYPCALYVGIEEYDSFISHKNQMLDMRRMQQEGRDAYVAVLEEKRKILLFLLKHYNDGRRKTLFCQAVNLLELPRLQCMLEALAQQAPAGQGEPKQRAALAAAMLENEADGAGVSLKLRKKPAKKPR